MLHLSNNVSAHPSEGKKILDELVISKIDLSGHLFQPIGGHTDIILTITKNKGFHCKHNHVEASKQFSMQVLQAMS